MMISIITTKNDFLVGTPRPPREARDGYGIFRVMTVQSQDWNSWMVLIYHIPQ